MKISKFNLSIIIIGIVYLILRFGIYPPIPSSLIYIYLGITIFSIFLYVSTSKESFKSFLAPIKAVLIEPGMSHIRQPIFIVLPILVTILVLVKMSGETAPPTELRSIHPAPPNFMRYRDKTIDILALENPLRKNVARFAEYVEEGAIIYFKNCFFCHGDNLDGKGHFAPALNPMPANFVDKGTIAQLQESFVFWRIAKGGIGLPNEGKPWNSAMPAWEAILTEDEIWKVIMYIYDASGVEPRTWEEKADQPEHVSVANAKADSSEIDGSAIYAKKCQYCHGITGRGDGPAAELLNPRPRDLAKARYKIKSTLGGNLPTDQDIFDIITKGIPGTSMPGWTSLSEDERWKLVTHVKSLAKRFKKSKEKGKPDPKPIAINNQLVITNDTIPKGRELFKELECKKCHGENGYGNGRNALELKDDWGRPIKPANLAAYWDFKGGYAVEDIYKTLTTGRAGTPMPSFAESASEQDRWTLAYYIRSIGPSEIPKTEPVLKSTYKVDRFPENTSHPSWLGIKQNRIPLFGQILVTPKLYTPEIDTVYVKSVFNEKRIAFLLEWDDITKNQIYSNNFDETKPIDAAAIQFPIKRLLTSEAERPYFFMGNKSLGVNLWKLSFLNKFEDINAFGFDKQETKEENRVIYEVAYHDGRYKAYFSRSLTTKDKENDIQFEINKFIPISFYLWDGSNGEIGSKMSLSTWSNVFLEKKEVKSRIVISVLIGLIIVVLEFFILWQVKRYEKNN